MPTVQDRVSANNFTTATRLSPSGIRDAGQRAIDHGRRFLTNTISEKQAGNSYIDYSIKGPGGLVTQMTFRVSWQEDGRGSRRVQLVVGDYMTAQQKLLAIIPLGPTTAPARVSLERFTTAFRKELGQGSAP